jgi:hypothetical protein
VDVALITSAYSRYRDERAFSPFSSAWRVALVPGRLFYLLPHDVRRNTIALTAPGRFRALQELRRGESASQYSLRPFDEYRCIFVHLPKVAGVSIAKSLFGGLGGSHSHIGLYQVVFSRHEFDSYFKFTFVRNPWDRLLSAYAFLRSGGMHESDRRWSRAHLAQFPTFKDFVLGWVNEENVLSYIHFVPQYRFVCAPFSRRLLVDFVGRYEYLERDFAHVQSRLGIDGVALAHHNKGPGPEKRGDFRDHYNATTRRIVERVYRTDLELFGYSFDS